MYYKQEKYYTCGANALRNALSNLNFEYSEEYIANLLKTEPNRGTWSHAFAKIIKRFPVNFVEEENTSLSKVEELIKKGFQIITCFFVEEENVDHYTVIKKIGSKEITLQDGWFGDNYKIEREYFKKIWFIDPNFEKRKRWIFAIKK